MYSISSSSDCFLVGASSSPNEIDTGNAIGNEVEELMRVAGITVDNNYVGDTGSTLYPPDTTVYSSNSPSYNLSGSPNEGKEMLASITGFGNICSPSSAIFTPMSDVPLIKSKPYVRIVEQPASNRLRFRYECEGRSAGALLGENSTAEKKTFPSIQVVGYVGPAIVVASCVEETSPYRVHPHNLVGRDGICRKGVCNVEFNNKDMIYQFQNLGIQCVRKKDAEKSLMKRKSIRVDPMRQGYDHAKSMGINLNAVRICFQVFLQNNNDLIILDPVVSNVIRDRKAHSDPQIIEYSIASSCVTGGQKILIFTEKVIKEDIEVRFTETVDGKVVWTSKAEFSPSSVHKQYGICFYSPPYHDQTISRPVLVSMTLVKPSDGLSSEPLKFTYFPVNHTELGKVQSIASKRNRPQKQAVPVKLQQQGIDCDTERDELSSGNVLGPRKIAANPHIGGGIVTTIKTEPLILEKQEESEIVDPFLTTPTLTFERHHLKSATKQSQFGSQFAQSDTPLVQQRNQLEHRNVSNDESSRLKTTELFMASLGIGSTAAAPENSTFEILDNNFRGCDGIDSLPNIDVNSADLCLMEGLSFNLDSSLKLNRAGCGVSSSSDNCDNGKTSLARNSSLLETPDVSGSIFP